jgi:ubiquinone/menaquinone biosynthesis C-methylase UbiE
MTEPATIRADYGIDAPPVVRTMAIAGVASLAAGIALYLVLRPAQTTLATFLLIWGLAAGLSLLATAGLMVWSSRVGKLRMREWLMDSLALRGNETVLDAGCGRGLLLNGAARRLTTGRAIGVDLWQAADQSGNSPEATLANARAEGVAERVEVRTGDMRELPIPDETVDVVVSSTAIHNIRDKEGRAQAVREIARVLKPEGRLALLDFQCTEEYLQTLRELGWQRAERSGLMFRMFPPVRLVRGTKPAHE